MSCGSAGVGGVSLKLYVPALLRLRPDGRRLPQRGPMLALSASRCAADTGHAVPYAPEIRWSAQRTSHTGRNAARAAGAGLHATRTRSGRTRNEIGRAHV